MPCKTSFVSALQKTITVIFSSWKLPSTRGQPRTHRVAYRGREQFAVAGHPAHSVGDIQ